MSKIRPTCPVFESLDTEGHDHPIKPLDVDKAAVFLIKKFGDNSAAVAYSRSYCCRCRGDETAAQEWNAVMKRIVNLLFSRRQGPLH